MSHNRAGALQCLLAGLGFWALLAWCGPDTARSQTPAPSSETPSAPAPSSEAAVSVPPPEEPGAEPDAGEPTDEARATVETPEPGATAPPPEPTDEQTRPDEEPADDREPPGGALPGEAAPEPPEAEAGTGEEAAPAPGEALPADSGLPPTEPSKRERAVIDAVTALGAGSGDDRERGRVADLRSRLSLWSSEIKVEASTAARRRSDLQVENRDLSRLLRRLPWDTRRRRISLAEARQRRADLVKRQEEYDKLYDVLDTAAEAASARLPESEALVAAAERGDVPPDVMEGLASVAAQTRKISDDYRAGADLAVRNAKLVGDILLALDPAIDAAQAASLLRRSPVQLSSKTAQTAWADLRRLGAWLRDYSTGALRGPGEYDVWQETASPLGLAGVLLGVVLVGAALIMGGRLLARYILAGVEARLDAAADDLREPGLWRVARAVEVLRAALVLAFLYLAIELLPLEARFARVLFGVVVAWTGYFAARPILRLALSPGGSRFRLIECDDRSARRISNVLSALMLLSASCLPLIAALSIFDYPHQDVRLGLKLVYGAAAVGLLLWLMNSQHSPTHLLPRPGAQLACDLRCWSTIAKPTISLAAIALLVLAFVGYVNLASYLARGIVLTALISAAAVPLQRRAARELDACLPLSGPAETTDAEPGLDPRYLALRYSERVVALAIVVWLLLRAWAVRGYHMAAVMEYASRPLVDVKGTRISVLGICKGLVVLLISYWIARSTRHRIEKSAALSRKWDEGVRHALASSLYYTVLILGGMTAILVAGLQLTVLAAFAGMVGIAVGFGSQDIAKNIICGLIIMIDRSINVGDYVDVAGQSGTIVDISIRSITIRTHDNRLVVVPNATFYTQNVVVSSQRDKRVRVTVELAVAGDTDLDKVTQILTETTAAEEGILPEPSPEVILSKLAAGALNLELIAWTDQIDRLPMVQGRLISSLWKGLKSNEIAMA